MREDVENRYTIQQMVIHGYKPEKYHETTHCTRDFMFFAVQPMLDPLLFKGSVLRYPPTIIDVGSGSNEFGQAIYKRYNLKTINFDVNYAIQRLHPEDTKITASIYKLPIRNESVDIILCKDVLAHVGNEHLDECFEEFNRILKPGGSALVVFLEQESSGIIADNPSFAPDEMPMYPHKLNQTGTILYERSIRIFARTEREFMSLTQEYYNRGDQITAPFYALDLDYVIEVAKSYQFDILESTYTQRDDTQDWYTPKHYQSQFQKFHHPTRNILLLTKPNP